MRASAAPFAVGAYIGGAYFFTASTSFANPAVTLARTLSNSFAGIAPASAPAFLGAQLVGAVAAVGLAGLLYPPVAAAGADVAAPTEGPGTSTLLTNAIRPVLPDRKVKTRE
jgi:arsenate reductase